MDLCMRAMAKDAAIRMTLVQTTALVERARQIHRTLPVATAALGRTLSATAMLGGQLKTEEGSVTVQVRGNGPLGTIVCVSDDVGNVRGYLQNPAVDLPLRADGKLDVGGGVGRGFLMVIKDVGLKDPVTGTVALESGEIAEDITKYYAESEQIPSACALGVLVNTDQSVRCAGGYLVQLLPGATDADIDQLENNLGSLPSMTTMLDRGMDLEQIAQAVLEGFDVEFVEKHEIEYRCSCNAHKVSRALISLGRQELEELAQQEEATELTCQFCDAVYKYTPTDIQALLIAAQQKEV